MKKLFLAFAVLCGAAVAAQETKSAETGVGQMSFFAEVGGPGILFSANIDRRFAKSSLGWGARAGFGFVTTFNDQYVTQPGGGGYYTSGRQLSVATFPLQVNYIFGKPTSQHTFEVGAGVTITGRKIDLFDSYYDQDRSSLFGTASFMYRRQPVGGGFSWRIGFTPIVGNGFIQPSGGISVGYNFN
ncbi:MAG: hypothetical protein JWP69_867 [Flaviaesturariibacter sp.]|nr:hypothetical protein [Flaviaesturariibacter sp.]